MPKSSMVAGFSAAKKSKKQMRKAKSAQKGARTCKDGFTYDSKRRICVRSKKLPTKKKPSKSVAGMAAGYTPRTGQASEGMRLL